MSKARRARTSAPQSSDVVWSFLTDELGPGYLDQADSEDFWEAYSCTYERWSGQVWLGPAMQDCWAEYGDSILEDWVARKPGTRPSCWWQFSAPRLDGDFQMPELRRQISGSGVRKWINPDYLLLVVSSGIPQEWVTGPDSADPPVFEAEATYLLRHGLLEPGERERLTETDFAPVTVEQLSAFADASHPTSSRKHAHD